MKKILFVCFCFIATSAAAQKVVKTERASGHSIHIIGDTFEGVIFAAEYDKKDTSKNFTPTVAEIIKVETLLPKLLMDIKDSTNYDKENTNYVREHLPGYYRQYSGYVNSKNELIIYIFALSKHSSAAQQSDWKKHKIFVYDGGTSYWQVQINLTTNSLQDFYVNGRG